MAFTVPLLYPSIIVLQRLDIRSTARVDPDGAGPLTAGYDPDLREPIPYEEVDIVDDSKDSKTTVRYLPAIRIPCQVETRTTEELNQIVQGDLALSNMVFVLHRATLRDMGLLDDESHPCGYGMKTKIKTNDRIVAIEKRNFPGVKTRGLKAPLYVVQVVPGSWGMGVDDYDLEMLIVANRPAAISG